MDCAWYLVGNNAKTGRRMRGTNGPSGLQPGQCIFRDAAQSDALGGNDEEALSSPVPLRYLHRLTKIPRYRPLRLVCHSFASRIYLAILGKDGIRSSLSDTCTKRSQAEPYNFIILSVWRFISSEHKHRCNPANALGIPEKILLLHTL